MARGLVAAQSLCNEPWVQLGSPWFPRQAARSRRRRKTTVASFLRSQAAAYLLLPLACACWAGNHVIARKIAGHAPPASVSLARWVVVFLVGQHLCMAADPGRLGQARGQGGRAHLPGADRRGGVRHPAIRGAAIHHGAQHGRGRLGVAGLHRRRELHAVRRPAGSEPAVRRRRVADRRARHRHPARTGAAAQPHASTAATSSSSSTWCSGRSIAPACGCAPPCTP